MPLLSLTNVELIALINGELPASVIEKAQRKGRYEQSMDQIAGQTSVYDFLDDEAQAS